MCSRSASSATQSGRVHQQRWLTRGKFRLAVGRQIDATYNRRRRQREIGKLMPIEHETIYDDVDAA